MTPATVPPAVTAAAERRVFALIGWVAGLGSILGVALLVFPALLGTPKSIRTGADLLAFALVMRSGPLTAHSRAFDGRSGRR